MIVLIGVVAYIARAIGQRRQIVTSSQLEFESDAWRIRGLLRAHTANFYSDLATSGSEQALPALIH